MPDGQYVLRSVADPLNKVYESPGKADSSRESAEDNEAITLFGVQKGQLVDTNPPTGTVRVNNIDAATTSPNVTVRVLGRDDISGVTQLRLSNDGSTWSTPQAYTGKESTAQAIAWDLTNAAYGGNNADGTKTVYVQFKDASGKWSASESDTIVLDRGGGSSPYSNAVLSDGPSGYWRLGEKSGTTANDASGGDPGSYKNGALLGQASLLPADSANASVRFDGTNDYVAIPSSSSLSPTSKVSVEAWIKPNALPSTGNFASIASKPESYSLQFNGPRLEFTIIQSGTRRRLQAPAGAIAVGQAYHLLGTYDGIVQRLYINGTEVASGLLTGAITANSNPLNIASWNGGSEPFNGTIDDVAVYTSALSAARASAHYQAANGGPPPDPTVKDPSGLEASAVSDTRIDLKWVDNSTNEGEFLIERDTSAGFGSPTTMGAWANSTTFSDTGLSPSTTYYYRVRARNATDSSGYSNTASATTQAPPPVKDPSGLEASAVSDTRIDLKWVDNSTNEGEFLIERDTSAGFGSPTTMGAPANSTAFSDIGLSPNTTYFYRVKARNATDSSGYSNTANAKTQEPPPPPSENYREAVLADGPVSYWRLGETSGSVAADEKGLNPGSYKNGALLGQASLLPADSANASVRFDGTNDYVAIPSSSSLSPTSKSRSRPGSSPTPCPAPVTSPASPASPSPTRSSSTGQNRVHDHAVESPPSPAGTRRGDRGGPGLPRPRNLRRRHPTALRQRHRSGQRAADRSDHRQHERARHRFLERRLRGLQRHDRRRLRLHQRSLGGAGQSSLRSGGNDQQNGGRAVIGAAEPSPGEQRQHQQWALLDHERTDVCRLLSSTVGGHR